MTTSDTPRSWVCYTHVIQIDPAPPSYQAKKPRSFLFYAAIAGAVLLAGAIVASALLAYGAKKLIIAYTDTAPMPLAATAMSAAEYEALEKRVESFKGALERSQETSTLVLSAEDINALIVHQANPAERVQDKFRVAVDGDKIEGTVSLPLGELGLPFAAGRYLNGAASFKVSLEDGVLIATIDSLMLNGRPLPEAVMGPFRNENLAKDVYRRPKTAEALRKLDSIKIADGRVSIRARASR